MQPLGIKDQNSNANYNSIITKVIKLIVLGSQQTNNIIQCIIIGSGAPLNREQCELNNWFCYRRPRSGLPFQNLSLGIEVPLPKCLEMRSFE